MKFRLLLTALLLAPPMLARSADDAILRVAEPGEYNFAGQTIRCGPEQQVGILVTAGRSVIRNAVIEDCQIGIMVPGERSTADASGVTIEGMVVNRASIGIWLAGDFSRAESNIVGGADYGFIVTGRFNTLLNNRSFDNTKDGYLVTGWRNTLHGNQAHRNGEVGIRVASTALWISQNEMVLDSFNPAGILQDRGRANTLEVNVAVDNSIDLFEFTFTPERDCSPPPQGGLPNTWTNNTFGRQYPWCVGQPSQTNIAATPQTQPLGGTFTVGWSGIASPTPSDWIGLYQVGASDTAFVDWIYASVVSLN